MTGKMYSWYLFYFQFMNSLPYTFLWVSWKCFHTVFLLSKMHLQNLLLCFFHSFVTCSSSVGFHRFKNITLHLFILLKCVLWLTNSERDGNTRAPDLPLEKPICKSGSNSYNWTWNYLFQKLAKERCTSVSKIGKRKVYIKVVYCHPAYLISIQNTSGKMSGWLTHKLDSRLTGEISTASDIHMTSS